MTPLSVILSRAQLKVFQGAYAIVLRNSRKVECYPKKWGVIQNVALQFVQAARLTDDSEWQFMLTIEQMAELVSMMKALVKLTSESPQVVGLSECTALDALRNFRDLHDTLLYSAMAQQTGAAEA